MILHLILNSLFVFLVLALSIECILFFLNIKNSRIRYFCRCLPILKLPFDFLVFTFYGESIFVNYNPLSCELYVQYLLSAKFKYELNGLESLIIPGYLAAQIPIQWLNTIILLITSVSGIFTIRNIAGFIRSSKSLKRVLHTSPKCSRDIKNEQLRKKLEQLNVAILMSSEIQVPFAAHAHYILFPEKLLQALSQDEFEAITAHELEHLRWKDPILKLLCIFICSFFWWIPSQWLLRRLESDQEQASDFGLNHYGLNTLPLATALVKVVNLRKPVGCEIAAICHLNSSRNFHVYRLDALLKQELQSENYFKSILGALFCLAAFMSFWMC